MKRIALAAGLLLAAAALAGVLRPEGASAVDPPGTGDTVTVSGLLVGADIERALIAHGPADRVLLPPNCLKEGEVFLDDRTRTDLESRLGVPVQIGFDAKIAA